MNTEEYIASGILELYVLGELTSAEAAEVEVYADKHPEIQKEILNIQDTIQGLALRSAVSPRPSLKNEILTKIQHLEKPGFATNKVVDSATHKLPVKKEQRTIQWLQYGMAASITLAILSVIAALYFRIQWKNAEQELSTTLAQNQQMAQQYQRANQDLQQLNQELSVFSNQNFQAVAMAGLDISPKSQANVYWNQNSAQVYLQVNSLPPNPAGKQYQLWAIVDGKPVDAGVFDVNPNANQRLIAMKNIQGASAFAVTLEPQGGSQSPTMEAMYTMGKVGNT